MSKKISKKIEEKQFTEVKTTFPAFKGNNTPVYEAREVDGFMEEISQDVQSLEGAAKKWYQELQEVKQILVETAEQEETLEQEKAEQEVNEELNQHLEEMTQAASDKVKDLPEGITKVQGHMVAFLEEAEARSSKIVEDALTEKNAILNEAEKQAREIIEAAMDDANQAKRKSQEELDRATDAKKMLELQAKEVQQEIIRRAERVERFGKDFEEFGASLKSIANEQKRA